MTRTQLQEELKRCFDQPWEIDETIYQRPDDNRTYVFKVSGTGPDGEPVYAAVKTIRTQACRKDKAMYEVELMKQLKGCPNIVSIHEYCWLDGDKDGCLLIRMELLKSLRAVSDETDFTEENVIRMALDICEALKRCYEMKIAHRDIKPENIFLSQDGAYKLGDFGISRILREGLDLTGTAKNEYTPMYAAPEILRAEKANYMLSDIYSLGLVCYKLLNNNVLPFGPCGQDEILQKRQSEKEVPLLKNCSEELQSIVWKALQYAPENRYQTVDEMQSDLIACVKGEGVVKAYAQMLCQKGRLQYENQNYNEAFRLFLRSFQDGYAGAERYLGLCYYHGYGTKQDHDRGVQMLSCAADTGDPEAAYCLGMFYYSQTVKKTDYAKAVRYFRTAAEKNHADAQFRLGYCYRKGYSVNCDQIEAEKWFRKAAEQGHAGAQSYLPQENYWGLFDWMYTNNDTQVKITKCKYIDDFGQVVIPNNIDGKPVTALSEQMFLYTASDEEPAEMSITDVILQLLTDPDDKRCCTKLQVVYIPESVTCIEPGTFYGCTHLQNILVSHQNPAYRDDRGILYDITKNALHCYPAGRTEKQLALPESIAEIEDYAFKFCKHLTAVTLTTGIERIGKMAFSGCKGLQHMELPEGVTSIGEEAFTYCDNLKQLKIPASVKSIGNHILSRRFQPQILCHKDSWAYWYASENLIDCKVISDTPLTEHQKQFAIECLLPLTVACERHPDGIPITSGSFGLIMSVCAEAYEMGGKDLLNYISDQFVYIYPSRINELWFYWNTYIEDAEKNRGK